MSASEHCDRCGKATDKPVGFITFHDYSSYPNSADTANLQLCQDCTSDFVVWKARRTA